MRDSGQTRKQLLDEALRLFSRRGIRNVALSEINQAAGQRNRSALHYHFGGREGALRAILQLYLPGITSRRVELLEQAGPEPDARTAAEIFILPVAELLYGDWRSRAFI